MSTSSLSADPDFRRLWLGDTVSQLGTAVTLVALPLVAIRYLDASPFQVALLMTFEYLAFAVIGLPVGVWVDRVRRRRVMVLADLGRAILLASVPVAGWLDVLSLAQLYVVTLGVSVGTTFFDVAYQSHLPDLVGDDRLVEGNVRLEVTRNAAQVGGPGLAGLVIAALSAPLSVMVNAGTFLVSAVCLMWIRVEDRRPEPSASPSLRHEVAEGLRLVLGNPVLRALTLTSAISNFCAAIGMSMLMMLLAGQLGLSTMLCGLAFSAEAVGGLLGALFVRRAVGRFGEGPAMCASVAASGLLWMLALPMFQSDWRLGVAMLLQALGFLVFMTFKVTAVSLRQRLCPRPLLGRMNATVRFVVWGGMPVGALLGGVLGETLGVRPAMWVGVVGELAAVVPLLLSPVRSLSDRSAADEPEAAIGHPVDAGAVAPAAKVEG